MFNSRPKGNLMSGAMLISSSHTAIMKGAVLYRLGMNSVRERVMRDNYGLSCTQIFRQRVHPESSKFIDPRGDLRTNKGVIWLANKVISPEIGLVKLIQ